MIAPRMFALLALGAVSLVAAALPVRAQPRCEVIGEGQDARFAENWTEIEGDWRGNWVPVDRRAMDGRYTAHWQKHAERTHADLQIQITGASVTVVRTQAEGTCRYNGVMHRDRWHMSGFYTCAWHRMRLPWTATVGAGHPTRTPSC